MSLAAKQLDNFCRLTVIGKIRKGENLNILNLCDPLVHVLIQQYIKNGLCVGRILAEKVFLLNIVSPFFSGQRLLAVCHITDEVEIVHIFHTLVCFQRF